jgi:hypothetical protein
MKKLMLTIPMTLIVCAVTSIALADDFKTNNGKEYKNATVTQVEADGIVVRTKVGLSKLYFTELPEDVRKPFHYDPQKAAAYSVAQAASIQQANQQANQQVEESNKQRREVESNVFCGHLRRRGRIWVPR